MPGMNLRLMHMETVSNVDEAVHWAAGAGMPAQNFVVADAGGRIAWTVIGAMPRRVRIGTPDHVPNEALHDLGANPQLVLQMQVEILHRHRNGLHSVCGAQ